MDIGINGQTQSSQPIIFVAKIIGCLLSPSLVISFKILIKIFGLEKPGLGENQIISSESEISQKSASPLLGILD